MPNIKSAVKRVELSKIRNLKNSAAKSALKTTIRRFEEALAAGPDRQPKLFARPQKHSIKQPQKA
jgi:ribosomal protein S20